MTEPIFNSINQENSFYYELNDAASSAVASAAAVLLTTINTTEDDGSNNFDLNHLYFNLSTNDSDLVDLHRSTLLFSPGVTVIVGILCGLMSLTTILGNILVITAFIIDKNLRNYSNYFILNLSIADLLIGLLIPPYAPFLLANRHWSLGRTACTLWLVLDYVVGSASVLCIVVISLDRYLLVSRGLNYVAKQKISKAILWMCAVWAIAFLNYAPAIILWKPITGKSSVPEGECVVEFHNNLPYLTASACVEFFVPFLTITILNLAVYLNIRKRSKGLIRSTNPQFCLPSDMDASTSVTNMNSKFSATNIKVPKCKNGLNMKIISKNAGSLVKNKNQLRLTFSPSVSSSSSEASPKLASIQSDHNDIQLSPTFTNSLKLNESTSTMTLNTMETCRLFKQSQSKGGKLQHSSTPSTPAVEQTAMKLYNNAKESSFQKKQSATSAKHSLTKDKKAARSLFILVFVFVICWAPYTLLSLIRSVCPTCVNDSVYELSFWLLWLNSTVNPILYPFLHVKFRKAFAKIICYCFKDDKSFEKGKKKSQMSNVSNTTYSVKTNSFMNTKRQPTVTTPPYGTEVKCLLPSPSLTSKNKDIV